MGLGLVDPILPAIGEKLHATRPEVELLFTSYILVTGVAMLVTGWVSSRLGPKRTLLFGLLLIVLSSAAAGASSTVGQIVGFRAGWGLGNALFIATALAVIVGAASGGTAGAIMLYEAALGLGISTGPLLGGVLGGISWRGPFFGVAALMAIGFLAILALLPPVEASRRPVSVLDPIRALESRGLLVMGVTALLYNYGFFTLLAFTPFVLGMDAHGLGLVFFGWGVMVAVTAVFLAPALQSRFGTVRTLVGVLILFALDLLFVAFSVGSPARVVVAVVAAGALLGVNNTLVTEGVMRVSTAPRAVASAGYSFVRFVGGGIAPWLAGKLADAAGDAAPYFLGAGALLLATAVLVLGRRSLAHIEEDRGPGE
ncbi:MAG: MFS transporter [Clostridia bacterium]|nr:MFS transporter [Clostridia bacterium]